MEEIRQASKRLKTVREGVDAEYQKFVDQLDQEEEKIEQRFESLDEKKKAICDAHGNPNASNDDLIEINAGGKIIAAKRGTLRQIEGTRLEALFSGCWEKKLQRDNDGRIFLDVNSDAFQIIVDYLNEMAISSPENLPQLPTTEGENEHIIDHLLELFLVKQSFDSTIIKDENQVTQLHDWLEEDGSDGDFRLLYRSTRDGQSGFDFHSRCDSKGCTLTLIETIDGLVVGGYSNTPWSSPPDSEHYIVANKAFLFCLSRNQGIQSPCKMVLRDPKSKRATFHYHRNGPSFGRDLIVHGPKLFLNTLDTYVTEPLIIHRQELTIKEVEVFRVRGSSMHKTLVSKSEQQPIAIQETTSFTNVINNALNAKLQTLKEAEQKVIRLENQLDDEEIFIDLFASGDAKDVVKLNVSGTTMATKRSTLLVFEESVLARQFDDSKWTEQGHSLRVKDWTPTDVLLWVQNIDDVSDDVANLFVENKITGNELLALEKDGLIMLGIERTGTLCLLLKEIKKLEKASKDVATLIEHSPYCFGKIVDFLRLRQLHSKNFAESSDLPTVRESERFRFEKVVKYFFPGESAELILGLGTPITIKMAISAHVDPNSSGNSTDALKDGRPLHTVTLVAAVRDYEEQAANAVMDVEDGTGCMQVEVRLNDENNISEICEEQSYIRIIGEVEDFGGQRRILASDVRPLSSGNDLTNHLLDVAQSYDKYLQTKQRGETRRGGVNGIGSMAPNESPQVSERRTQRQSGGIGMGALGYFPGAINIVPRELVFRPIGGGNSDLNNAVIECIQDLGAHSDSGVHVDMIIRIVSSQGFSADEVRSAINYLSNEGHIYSTIDWDNYQYAS